MFLATSLTAFTALLSQAAAGPLHEAVKNGDIALVETLIADGEDVNQTDRYLGTPLHQAAIAGSRELTEFLLAEGADANAENRILGTPLHVAARKGHQAVAVVLISNGAKTSPTDREGTTPLHAAAEAGHVAIVELLISNGADVNARKPGIGDSPGYDPPVQLAGLNGYFDVVDLLEAYGAAGPRVEPVAALLTSADVSKGELVFEHSCGICHVAEKGSAVIKRGPNLWGVLGRDKASLEDFAYSPAFARLVGTWTLAELNAFIASPVDYVPGTSMGISDPPGFVGVRDKLQRANLIAFLRQKSGDPVPLPTSVPGK
ncbi:MAG: ankyrin repeat domain-containing protein [Bauldia sp.]|nr:ankyrin repeat domain-containing protein [Bauldia sp.]